MTEDKHKEARASFQKDCKVCIWAVEAGGGIVVTHGGECGNVIEGVRNDRPYLHASVTTHEASAVLRPTKRTANALAAEQAVQLMTGMDKEKQDKEWAQFRVHPSPEPSPDRPAASTYPMSPKGLEEFFEFLHRSNMRLMKKKNADYANSDDVFFNLRRGGEYGVIIRMDDKVSRLLNLLKEGADAPKVDESIDDTLRDLGIYSSLCLAMRHEARQRKEST